ncbi:DUF3068 domain-containing protein [Nocardia cyriacigeorgica]|uniref:DUF3068 domain-containing protein n=1 Tax=Nocardia cyriacigeorgica TaxID=135487 RepID=UPI0024589846|nr:DUF3068 domain-containing protein [Nocardia cyriacigeorgica]
MAQSAGTKRTVACLLVGLGALLIVAALMIPTYTLSKMAKTPLDLEITTVATNAEGTESLVLDSKSLTAPEGSAKVDADVPLVFQRFVTVEEPSDATEMTVQAGTTLRRTDKQGDTGLLTAEVDRVTIDRKSGEPVDEDPNGSIAATVNKEGESVADPFKREGLQYRFPIGTEKKDYPYFDRTARVTSDAKFIEETEINGTKVYHFQQVVPPSNLWEASQQPAFKLTLPAAKWGMEGDGEVTMYRWYTNTRDLFVEPETGTVVDGQEAIHMYYGETGDKPQVTALKATLTFDEPTIESQLDVAKENIDKLSLFGRIVPIILGVVGVIALIAGLVLGIRGGGAAAPAGRGGVPPRRPAPAAPTAPSPRRGDADAPTETIKLPEKP